MKNFLLIIDIQKGFIVQGANDTTLQRIDRLLETQVFDCVISTVYQNYPGSPIIRLMGWDQLLTSQEQALVGNTAHQSDRLVYKSTYSGYCQALTDILREENGGQLPETVFVAGVDTDCCVLATATDLFEAGIRPIVLTRYCGSSGGEGAHLAGLRCMESLVGSNNLCHREITSRQDLTQAVSTAEGTVHKPRATVYDRAAKVIDLLSAKHWHIAFAESCTGGKAAAALVDVPSASSVLDASFVTYANEAKVRFVGVSPDTIAQHGVVSEPVARQMAKGAAQAAGAQVGVGITGIAGPSGATASKPVGMVCFGFWIDGKEYTFTRQFGELGRSAVREASVEFVYETLLDCLRD